MTPDQARQFHRKGYLKLPGVVPKTMALQARRLIFERMGELRRAAQRTLRERDHEFLTEATQFMFRSGETSIFMDLYDQTPVRKILERALGASSFALRGAQLATLFPSNNDEETNETGYLNRDTPHLGWSGHLDGLWNGGTSPPRAGTHIRGRHLAAWQREPSTNGLHKTFPEHCVNLTNFTALVGIALSDQRLVGCGNLGLLPGGHLHMQNFFQMQRDAGGPLGPDGPGWKREDEKAPNKHGLRHYPDDLRSQYKNAVTTPDGKIWPEPTLVRLNVGDAVIVHFSTPHGGTRVTTSDPRLMVYFRCTTNTRPDANRHHYPDALCDNLLEWPGVARHIKRTRRRTAVNKGTK